MELWIRSQDKTTLIRSYEIYISEYGKGSYVIRAKKTSHILGTYKTMERALEVLDEIQKLLQPIYKVTNDFKKSELTGNCQWIEKQEYIPIQTKVYQMPEN